ncbi:hypothetical protein KZX64_10750 [Bacillus pumilus]|uniref:hypothetical protein n=1 Tax=Bacillus TaxID=1386 RepID=UPI00166F740A|nr:MULTISPECIES: hypothetical protein [Bacillus]MCK6164063.1 hypothetical protein [Bacillus pumilus]MCK6184569.1 hypothetical protein [Bacillus pumilus]
MKYLFTASRLIKAKDIVKQCQMRHTEEGLILLAAVELQIRTEIENRKKQQAPTLTA